MTDQDQPRARVPDVDLSDLVIQEGRRQAEGLERVGGVVVLGLLLTVGSGVRVGRPVQANGGGLSARPRQGTATTAPARAERRSSKKPCTKGVPLCAAACSVPGSAQKTEETSRRSAAMGVPIAIAVANVRYRS